MNQFKLSNKINSLILGEMQRLNLVGDTSYVIPTGLRREISTNDVDFRRILGYSDIEEQIVDDILFYLKQQKIVKIDTNYDKTAFAEIRQKIRVKFEIPYTSITYLMERFLYMLSSLKQPENMIALGVYCGNTLVWNAAPLAGSDCVVRGVDIDSEAIEIAKGNFEKIEQNVELIAQDAIKVCSDLDEEFDYVYIDADDSEKGKGLYLDILKILYPKIKKGGWILAHDTTYPWSGFPKQLEEYLSFVRDKKYFSNSYSFNIDLYGLEVTIK